MKLCAWSAQWWWMHWWYERGRDHLYYYCYYVIVAIMLCVLEYAVLSSVPGLGNFTCGNEQANLTARLATL